MFRLFKFWSDRNKYLEIKKRQELRAHTFAVACSCGGTMALPSDRLTGAPSDRVAIDRGPVFTPLEKSSIKKAREVLRNN